MDVNKILQSLQNDPGTRRTAMAGAGGLAAGMLMGGSGKKMLGKAAKYGAVAALGGLAYHAWQRSRDGSGQGVDQAGMGAPPPQPTQNPAYGGAVHEPVTYGPSGAASQPPPALDYEAAPANTAFAPSSAQEADELGRTLVQAMIAAAKADGKIDADEQARIFQRLESLDLSAEDKAFVFDALSRPVDMNALVDKATSPELAAEIYAASLVAIEADTPAEKAYLQLLATRLGLEPALVRELHATAGAAAPA